MFFAYTDDSRTKHNGVLWQIMATVLVKDSQFRTLEAMLSVVSDNVIPPEKQAQFTEFKASDIYGGHGLYEGMPQNVRRAADNCTVLEVATVWFSPATATGGRGTFVEARIVDGRLFKVASFTMS